ncbi:metal-independent alpha-mannosidase [Cohnella endophytica]|uniref:Metal-independent alpha-mannosidase n=1 Tax=Cohnella endophytica TaxID=2419778 RepID=A0A494X8U0_9BACL|nr:glycoside hydrolase family 125 protein [Cohnella endophytica]RKP44796.1 metal-independent alpha-mannosidase [Cohnella endophytica]
MARLANSLAHLNQWIGTVQDKLPDRPKTQAMFATCIRNTIETTFRHLPDGTAFVITGDIPAMWLRDSAAQARPYLLLAAQDSEIENLLQGIVESQLRYVIHDPYANAFNDSPNGQGHQKDDTVMTPWIWERKYEVDSLCYPLQLAYLLWKNAGSTVHFNETFKKAASLILDVWTKEQNHEHDSEYRFERGNCPISDTLPRNGKGTPTGVTGMTWSGFRPSDDACEFGYLIPSNMFAVVVLGYLAEIAEDVLDDPAMKARAESLAKEIADGIAAFGTYDHPVYGRIYAYETDGLGHSNLMDDANVPSLLSIPYLGYARDGDPVYANTRRFILSKDNPYYYAGTEASGIGSPHTPKDYIWPIAIAMQGLTSDDPEEKVRMLDLLERTDGGKGMMHEGFHKDDPTAYTREWFSWANMMYCELVLDVCGIRVKR